ncbi:DUF3563 family protein [Glaciimonas immobilis]|uniref:DUF3563 domain-containing protein n=1 Tax=Glaciimonas immobilis TaxID=728004 RepID=A0A840RS33_9BURK|nr:DUF3563 family protein [Glaciimonas immobilis]KAF3997689.1 DUF3563 family protein [Glaciimonas immobilis]MBB5200595.1 hypothetical protein [Glaciimonas immobilis]
MSTLTISSNQEAHSSGLFSSVTAFFKRIGNAYELSEAARKEAYLSEAADLYDLEYRIRQMDRETVQSAAWMKGY